MSEASGTPDDAGTGHDAGPPPAPGTHLCTHWSRRRAIRIVAVGAGLPLLMAAVRAAAPAGQFFTWQGDVLGAVSELTLWHTDVGLARRTMARVRVEIARYERIFSLDRP